MALHRAKLLLAPCVCQAAHSRCGAAAQAAHLVDLVENPNLKFTSTRRRRCHRRSILPPGDQNLSRKGARNITRDASQQDVRCNPCRRSKHLSPFACLACQRTWSTRGESEAELTGAPVLKVFIAAFPGGAVSIAWKSKICATSHAGHRARRGRIHSTAKFTQRRFYLSRLINR